MKQILKPADIVLWPRENIDSLYRMLLEWLKGVIRSIARADNIAVKLTKIIVDAMADWLKHKYAHVEVALLNNYLLGAHFNGVTLWRPASSDIPQLLKSVHIYRLKFPVDEQKFLEVAYKYYDRPYDFTSLMLNAAVVMASLGNGAAERYLEEQISKFYNNDQAMICSELVARIFEDLGYKMERNSEFVTPDDIAQSDLVERVF